MSSNNQAVQTAALAASADTVGQVAQQATPVTAPAVASVLPALEVGQEVSITVTKVVHNKEGNAFLLRCQTAGGHRGTLHVSEVAGFDRVYRDSRINEIDEHDELQVEVLQVEPELRFSERLLRLREYIGLYVGSFKLQGIVLEDSREDSDSIFLDVHGMRARLHASKLKDESRKTRDERIKSFKKDDSLLVSIIGFKRNPRLPVFQIDLEEFGRVEPAVKSPAANHKAQHKPTPGPSPLGNKTGDRAKAEAKRAERRERDQQIRNKMKTAGGKK